MIELIRTSLTLVLLGSSVYSAPTKSSSQRRQKLESIQSLEAEALTAASAGRLRDAVRLEQSIENEIMSTAMSEIFTKPGDARDWKLVQEMLRRDSHVVSVIASRLKRSTRKQQEGVEVEMKRNKRQAELLSSILGASSGGSGGGGGATGNSDGGDGGSSGAGLITSLLGASSSTRNRQKRALQSQGDPEQIFRKVHQLKKDKLSKRSMTNPVTTNRSGDGNNSRSGNLFDVPGLAELWGLSPPPSSLVHPENFNPPEGFPPFIADQGIADIIDITNDLNDFGTFFDAAKVGKPVKYEASGSSQVGGGLVGGADIKNAEKPKDDLIKKEKVREQVNNSVEIVGKMSENGRMGELAGSTVININVPSDINVKLPQRIEGGSGLIGGTDIGNSNGPQNVGVTIPQGGTGLIGGVNQMSDAIGLIGGTVIVNRPSSNSQSTGSGTGLIGGVEVFNVPEPPSVLHPPSSGGGTSTGFGDSYLPQGEMFNWNSGTVRPAKLSNGNEGYNYPKPTDSYGPPAPPSHGGGGGGGSDSFGALGGLLMGLLAPFSAPLSGSSSGSSSGGGGDGGDGGHGSDSFGSLLGLVGPLSSSSSGGGDEGGGSNILGLVTGLIGPLSGSSSGGGGGGGEYGETGGGGASDSFGALAGLSGPLSGSSSGGGSSGGGDGSSGGGGLISSLLSSSSGGGGERDGDGGAGGGGSGVASLVSSVLGSSSSSVLGSSSSSVLGSSSGGGGGGRTLDLTGGDKIEDDEDEDEEDEDGATGGSNVLSLVSGVLGSSSSNGMADGENGDGGAGSNVLGLLTSLVSATSAGGGSSGGTGDPDNGNGGNLGTGSGSILPALTAASSAGGDGEGTDGGGSLIGVVAQSSFGSLNGPGGLGDFRGQLLSMLFRIKFAIFRTLLSLITGFLGAASSSG